MAVMALFILGVLSMGSRHCMALYAGDSIPCSLASQTISLSVRDGIAITCPSSKRLERPKLVFYALRPAGARRFSSDTSSEAFGLPGAVYGRGFSGTTFALSRHPDLFPALRERHEVIDHIDHAATLDAMEWERISVHHRFSRVNRCRLERMFPSYSFP